MNKQIKTLGAFLVICYVALFVKLNQIQVLDADKLNSDPNNARPIQREFNRARGQILSSDGSVLAVSVAPADTSDVTSPRVRLYPEGELFAQITGYYSWKYLATGVEASYNDALLGKTFDQQIKGLSDLFSNNENVGNVTLTVNRELQAFARDNFHGPRGEYVEGAVVALDPKTGAILAMWSNPSFDPNRLSNGSGKDMEAYWAELNARENQSKPLLSKAFQDVYPPGSTFKVVTAGIGLETGTVTNDKPDYERVSSWQPPRTTKSISNFDGETCGGKLPEIMTVSCNTAFAQMGAETVKRDGMVDGAAKWGFNSAIPIDLGGAAQSRFPPADTVEPAFLAQMSIGQYNTRASPLTMALVAAGAANDGRIMTPHVMRDVRNSEGQVVTTYEPNTWLDAMTPAQADVLKDDLYGPVNNTGGTAQGYVRMNPGYKAGGKTGTAQVDPDNKPGLVHAWFMGFAGKDDGSDPQVAVAAVVLNQGGGTNDATGGQFAGPIVSNVMNKALEILNRK